MEVTTVSPSPASPTEGDDLCETDVTNVTIHSVTLLIILCGLAGNGAVLGLLSLKCHNTGIFHVAFTDFIFLLFRLPSALLLLVQDFSCSHSVPLLYLNFLSHLSVITYYQVLLWLLLISQNVNMYKFCMLCFHCNLPERLLWLVYSVPYWAFVALFTFIPAVTNLCPSKEQEQCQVALSSIYTVILLLFAVPVLISSTIDFIRAKRGSKRRSIVLFLIVLFILLLSLCNFLQQLGYVVVSFQVDFLLNCIHSSIKPFIYFLAGRCWSPCALSSLRLSLQRVFDEQKEKAAHRNYNSIDTVL